MDKQRSVDKDNVIDEENEAKDSLKEIRRNSINTKLTIIDKGEFNDAENKSPLGKKNMSNLSKFSGLNT